MRELKMVSAPHDKATLAYITSGYSEDKPFCITLLDGSDVAMSASDFSAALALLLSDEFDDLLELINRREHAHEDMGKFYDVVYDAVTTDSKCNPDAVYELVHAGKRYGRFSSMVRELKEDILDKHLWSTWVDTCRLYESIYRIPREWIA